MTSSSGAHDDDLAGREHSDPSAWESCPGGAAAGLWGEPVDAGSGTRDPDRPGPASTGPAGTGYTHDALQPQVLDRQVLDKLRGDLGGDDVADQFVADFVDLLDERVRVLGVLVEKRKIEAAVTALLTIETSGLMVGARQLSHVAARLRSQLDQGRLSGSDASLGALVQAAEQAKSALDLTLPSST